MDVIEREELPDPWGYDYKTRRFMSPLMIRGLAIALAIPLIALLLVLILGGLA